MPTQIRNNTSIQPAEPQNLHPSSRNLEQTQANPASGSSRPLVNYQDETIEPHTLDDYMTLDIDLLLEQGNNLANADIQPMDWDQWDTLIENWNTS